MRIVDRILAISDVHGENTKFIKLLKQAAYEPENDLLVICGDLIDRGEENLAVIETCMKLQKQGAIILKGNHEQMLEQILKEMIDGEDWHRYLSLNIKLWREKNGGEAMYYEIRKLPKEKLMEILEFVQGLPIYFASGKYIFTHAGGNVVKSIETNTEDELVWGDKSFPSCKAYPDKITVFGHIPTWLLYPYTANHLKNKKRRTEAKIWFDTIHKDKIGIDCGGVFGGRLAAIELPSYREFYI